MSQNQLGFGFGLQQQNLDCAQVDDLNQYSIKNIVEKLDLAGNVCLLLLQQTSCDVILKFARIARGGRERSKGISWSFWKDAEMWRFF